MTPHYDVIIVGGRPAGSTLAARLGKQGLHVMMLERAEFPSLPAASSPIIFAPAMQLLDEIGAPEADYARATPRITRMAIHRNDFQTTYDFPITKGRNYAYAIDRARFDAALWDHALGFPTVEGRLNTSVTDLLWEGDRVIGVVAKEGKGPEEHLTADLVIGADGRFSVVARKTEAHVIDEHPEEPTTLYYAYWKNVQPYDDRGPLSVAYEGGPGFGLLVMDSADGTAAITLEGRADLVDPAPGQAEALYLDLIQRQPDIARRIQGAERVTPVQGMKRIGNLYRQPGGPGWALVGDAYHQHDPLDGQGIFNALFTAKSLAWAIHYWRSGEKDWPAALEWYDETARIKTYGMFRATLQNVRQNIYADNTQVPEWALTSLRWMMEDDSMRDLMGKLMTRQVPPEVMSVMMPGVMAGALLRGPLRDLRKRLAG